MGYPTTTHGEDSVACLVSPLADLKPLATEREHLGHEGHAIETPFAIERAQNFVFTPNFDPVANSQLG